MLTPSGRFDINKKICLTNSGYHKETWSPMWNLKNMVIAFVSIFSDDNTSGISHIRDTPQNRKKINSMEDSVESALKLIFRLSFEQHSQFFVSMMEVYNIYY